MRTQDREEAVSRHLFEHAGRRGRPAAWLGLCFGLSVVLLFSAPAARPLDSPTPQPTRTPPNAPTATPPTQAGHGKDVFYIHCMPCHGDEGQGLTDEFRIRQYPPEDTNCWNSGCHGDRPYEGGFTLPKTVPALIGPDALKRFNTAADVFNFIRAAMPFNAPGSLSQIEYLQLTAFLLERNGMLASGSVLDPASAASVFLRGAPPTPTPGSAAQPADGSPAYLLPAGIAVVVIGAVIVVVVRRRQSV